MLFPRHFGFYFYMLTLSLISDTSLPVPVCFPPVWLPTLPQLAPHYSFSNVYFALALPFVCCQFIWASLCKLSSIYFSCVPSDIRPGFRVLLLSLCLMSLDTLAFVGWSLVHWTLCLGFFILSDLCLSHNVSFICWLQCDG